MSKKKLIGMMVALVLVAALGIGATLAYFTSTTETLSNVVTMGNVAGFIAENQVKEADNGYEFDNEKEPVERNNADGVAISYEVVMPGDHIDKNPTVILKSDSQDAYVRVKMDISIDDGMSDTDVAAIEDAIKGAIDTEKWVYNTTDGFYYYQTALTAANADDLAETDYITAVADEAKATLFTGFDIDSDISNAAMLKNFKIDVYAELIQAANVSLNEDGNAWVAADGSAIEYSADGAKKVTP